MKHQKNIKRECIISAGKLPLNFGTKMTLPKLSDNCHSHVAMALNLMEYKGRTDWNMVNLCFLMLFRGRFVDFASFLKTWGPLLFVITIILIIVFVV